MHVFRNAVLAYKLQALQAAGRAGGLVVVLGPTHSPIEDDLRTAPADLLDKLRAIRPAVDVTAPATVSEVCRLDFAGGHWRATDRRHHADLRPLAC